MTRNPLYQSLADQICIVDQLLEMRAQGGGQVPAHWHSAITTGVAQLNALNKAMAGQAIEHRTFGRLTFMAVKTPVWVERGSGLLRFWSRKSAKQFMRYRSCASDFITWGILEGSVVRHHDHFTNGSRWHDQARSEAVRPDEPRRRRPTSSPPSHPNCRCVTIGVDDITQDQMDSLRSAMSLLVPAANLEAMSHNGVVQRADRETERLREDERRYGREQADDLASMRAMSPSATRAPLRDTGSVAVRFVNSWGSGWDGGFASGLGIVPWPEAHTHEVQAEPPKVEQSPVEATKTKRRLNF